MGLCIPANQAKALQDLLPVTDQLGCPVPPRIVALGGDISAKEPQGSSQVVLLSSLLVRVADPIDDGF